MGHGPGPGRGRRSGQGQGQGQGPGQGPGRGPAAPRRGRKEKKDNMKPKHPDEQEIPFRLRELMRSREAMKRPEPGQRRVAEKKQQPQSKGPEAQGDIPVPKFRRGKGESERSYVCRMEQEVQRVLFLTKNQLQREPEKEATAPEKSKRKKEFQKKKLEKVRKKKEEKKEAVLEKSLFQDTVAFGEVVTQPPTITSRPRGQGPAEQAGRKQLLLTSHLGQSRASAASPAAPVSMARRRIVEEERARVIQAYRDIQRRKQREAARGSTQARRRVPR
ncbi:coiled-coil domain-containing protein 137 [Nyctibius grandis]|uniref:coiled-coil domain-containing protein 137 n=1 Tax=Nyctibius grandis TaxID=48427 RepID=UPI0035BC19E1